MRQAEALETKVIQSLAELQSIRDEWTALCSADACATPFQSPQWLIPWAECFGVDQLLTLAIYRGGELAALAPLFINICVARHERQLLLLGAGTSDYLGCIAVPESGNEVLREMVRGLFSQPGWDTAHFDQLRSGSLLLRLPAIDPRISRSDSEPCFRILLRFPQTLPAKLRSSIGYYRRRAEAIGELRFLRASSTAMALEFFESLVVLHTRRWQALGESGVLTDKCVLAHHRAAIPLLQESDLLRIRALQLNCRTIGVIYALADPPSRRERSFYYYLAGFDPDFHWLSPGTLLLAGLVDEARAEGAMAVDLLRGQESYKKFWGVERVATYAVNLSSPDRST